MFHVEHLPAEVDEKDRDVGGRDTGDTGGLGNCAWTVTFELDATFNGKRCQFLKIEVIRNRQVFKTPDLFGLTMFAFNVTGIFDLNFRRIEDFFLIHTDNSRFFPS